MQSKKKNEQTGITALYCRLSREKANQKETIKIPSVRLEGKIPSGYTVQQKEDFIVKAVDHYNKYRARQRDRDSR